MEKTNGIFTSVTQLLCSIKVMNCVRSSKRKKRVQRVSRVEAKHLYSPVQFLPLWGCRKATLHNYLPCGCSIFINIKCVFFKHTFSFSMDILFINLTLGQNLSYFYQIIYISFMCMEDLYHTMKKIMQLYEMIAACYIETSGSFIRIFFIFLGNLLRSVLFF